MPANKLYNKENQRTVTFLGNFIPSPFLINGFVNSRVIVFVKKLYLISIGTEKHLSVFTNTAVRVGPVV